MRVPVYVVTGFLGSGKTTLINKLLDKRPLETTRLLLVQFEAGEKDFDGNEYVCQVLSFSKKELDANPKDISKKIARCADELSIDEIWVEWNGMAVFSELQSIFLERLLRHKCKIEKVVHIADTDTLDTLLGKTGAALPEQISVADLVVLRHVSGAQVKNAVRLVNSLNRGVKIADAEESSLIIKTLAHRDLSPVSTLCLSIVYALALVWFCSRYVDFSFISLNTLVNVFLGIILQAVPFLLLGVLISSAIQIFVSSRTIERRFPKKLGLGMLTAILMGFCLPVCDCASVPIFRSLVKKGIPVPVAVTFLTAAPVINPVVMLSTYYAFNGSLRVVAVRVGLGIMAALFIGLFFSAWPSKNELLSSGGFDGAMCSCGCYTGLSEANGLKDKLRLYARHAETEFFSVGKFLLIGAFISALFQTIGTKTLFLQTTSGYALSLLLMMVLAFLLSLCSSSDAVIARSFSSVFPTGAVMGFLVFGPMMDIKNLLMLSGGFSKKFVLKLLLAVFLICYLVVIAFARPFLGV
ncbi:MAG: permease [Firmicutes bacterium HGW-Firmicutes-16]|nr:MAG: permease [Firmicutes bacterium HGW-Firmicutes-16]